MRRCRLGDLVWVIFCSVALNGLSEDKFPYLQRLLERGEEAFLSSRSPIPYVRGDGVPNVVRQIMMGHLDRVTALEILPDRTFLFSGSDDGTVRGWDTRTLRCIMGFSAKKLGEQLSAPVKSIAIHPRRDYEFYISTKSQILCYDLRKPASSHVLTGMQRDYCDRFYEFSGSGEIGSIKINHIGDTLAAIDALGAIFLLNLNRGTQTRLSSKHNGTATCVAWRCCLIPLQHELVTGGQDGRILIHDTRWPTDDPTSDGPLVHEFTPVKPPTKPHQTPVRKPTKRSRAQRRTGGDSPAASDISAIGAAAAAGVAPTNLSSSTIATDHGGSDPADPEVLCLDISPDGRCMVSGHSDGLLREHNLFHRRLDRVLPGGHAGPIRCLSLPRLSPPWRLATGGADGVVKLWDLVEDSGRGPLILAVPHRLPPAAIALRSYGYAGPAPHMFVCDASRYISAYTFKP